VRFASRRTGNHLRSSELSLESFDRASRASPRTAITLTSSRTSRSFAGKRSSAAFDCAARQSRLGTGSADAGPRPRSGGFVLPIRFGNLASAVFGGIPDRTNVLRFDGLYEPQCDPKDLHPPVGTPGGGV
jgi:hypothetical protein